MPATRNRTPRLALLDSSVRRSASSPFTSRSGSATKRRIVVVVLVVLSLALITASFRESSGGRLHGVQNTGAAVLRPFEVATGRVARPFRDAYDWFRGLVTARSQNKSLRQQVQDLRQKYAAAESAQKENAVLQALLAYERGPSFPKDYSVVNAAILTHLSIAQETIGDTNSAFATAQRALLLDPNLPPVHKLLGDMTSNGSKKRHQSETANLRRARKIVF